MATDNVIYVNSKINTCNKWSGIPYPGQTLVEHGIDNSAGSWPLFYFNHNLDGTISNLSGEPVALEIINPCSINFLSELSEVITTVNNITPLQANMAKYWGTGVPLSQISPILLTLISTYKITPAMSARIMTSVQNVINDAFVITWHLKYLYDIPRPCQLDLSMNTILPTPKFPSYPSGHSVVSAAASVVMAYYFPGEKDKLYRIAEEASISRLYAGVHFRSDLSQGLRLGRQIGSLAIEHLKKQSDLHGIMVDTAKTEFKDANILPIYI